MARSPKQPESKRRGLTSTELEMMNIIWDIGPCTVAEVRERLSPERDLAYTSVSTIVRILEKKGFVSSTREGRNHIYTARVDKETYQETALKHLVQDVFDERPTLIVQRLIDSDSLTVEELREIRALLSRRTAKR